VLFAPKSHQSPTTHWRAEQGGQVSHFNVAYPLRSAPTRRQRRIPNAGSSKRTVARSGTTYWSIPKGAGQLRRGGGPEPPRSALTSGGGNRTRRLGRKLLRFQIVTSARV
jgi:hypothetical protein